MHGGVVVDVFLAVPVKAGLRAPDAEANDRATRDPKGGLRMRRGIRFGLVGRKNERVPACAGTTVR